MLFTPAANELTGVDIYKCTNIYSELRLNVQVYYMVCETVRHLDFFVMLQDHLYIIYMYVTSHKYDLNCMCSQIMGNFPLAYGGSIIVEVTIGSDTTTIM